MSLENYPEIKALILDMDGVLWRGDQPIGDLNKIIGRIEELGLKYILSTNNSTKTPEQYQKKLAALGATVSAAHIITSSMALASMLKTSFPGGGNIFIIGESGLLKAMQQQEFITSEKGVIAVVAGLDRHITYEKLQKATILIRSGIPFFGTNPDKTFPTPQGLVPGAGAILSLLETATGVSPIIAGKPHRYMFDLALSLMQVEAQQAMSIGDRLETDILGGSRIGCKTALVLSGVTNSTDLLQATIHPDIVVKTLSDLLK